MKHIIDINTWERKENYEFFLGFQNPTISITSEVECAGAKARAKAAGESFFLHYLYAVLRAVNEIPEIRFRIDPEGREDLMAVMRELQKKFQLTIISITHDLTEIALSDRTLVFQKGKLESSMTPRELFSRNDLNEIGLDKPFSKQVQESLSSHFPLKQDYLTESELLDQLWESL